MTSACPLSPPGNKSQARERRAKGREGGCCFLLCFDWKEGRLGKQRQQQSLVFAEARGLGFLRSSPLRFVLDGRSLFPARESGCRVDSTEEAEASLLWALASLDAIAPAAATD